MGILVPAARIDSVAAILRESAGRDPEAAAILAPGKAALSYGALAEQAARIGGQLRALGIASHDRVALALPNGPELATAFLGVAAAAGCAPLNPNYRKTEFEFYLGDLRAAALVVDEHGNSAAEAAAANLGIPIVRIQGGACAGEFRLVGETADAAAVPDWATSQDTALLLHTSGTTARPKLAPLSGANLAASARNIGATLALTPADRCLNIMPLFHIHGLMAAVLATIRAGGSVVCTDGVYGADFFDWLRAFRPTWYTAVPTMHQAIAALAAEHAGLLRECPLRFIRSSSASLPPQLLGRMEELFEAPVIEAYGMTEAAHQMASNPLPPGARKPGSVGRAAGPRIGIMDDAGNLLEPGATGEVVIRGDNVMAGYEGNPAANAHAFTAGWFRTGDQGVLGADGCLRLTGRLKELINRGGEKIAPREIDEALLSHPRVKQAVAFAIPHAQLGEEVGAAVELLPGEEVDGNALRQWAGAQLAAYKTPRIVVTVKEIPKGPTGKLQRIGLAERLGVAPLDDAARHAAFIAPRDGLEERIAAVWREVLRRKEIGALDRWESLGGDSLLAVRMLSAVGGAEGVDLPYLRFLTEGTIESLAREIQAARTSAPSLLLPIQPRGARTPLIWFPGHDGLNNPAVRLAEALGPDQPVWALDIARASGASTLRDLAAACGAALLERPELGPWRLAGQCFGGFLALETAHCLRNAGAKVDRLILIDAFNPAWCSQQRWTAAAGARWRAYRFRASYHRAALLSGADQSRIGYVRDRLRAFLRGRGEALAPRGAAGERRALSKTWTPRRWEGGALIVCEPGRRPDAPAMGWSEVIAQIDEVVVPFYQTGPLAPARIRTLAGILGRYLATVSA